MSSFKFVLSAGVSCCRRPPACESVARLSGMVRDNDPPKAGAATYRFIPKNRQQDYITHTPV